ncbi:MAG: hypothetical protein ACP5M4_12385, partial [Acidobacteriaceae bacterium]
QPELLEIDANFSSKVENQKPIPWKSHKKMGQRRVASPVPQICVIAVSFVSVAEDCYKISSGQWPLVTTRKNANSPNMNKKVNTR